MSDDRKRETQGGRRLRVARRATKVRAELLAGQTDALADGGVRRRAIAASTGAGDGEGDLLAEL